MDKNQVPKKIYRSVDAADMVIDEEKRTISFAFSSETPYERWWGVEILSHKAGAMDQARLNDGAPLLFNHDPDKHIGTIERSWIDKNQGWVEIRFGNSALAQEKKKDVEDKVLRKVSFGYMIDDLVLSKKGDESGPAEYTVTKFTPFEVSFVTIPADNSVGLGRTVEGDEDFKEILAAANRAFEIENRKTAGDDPAKGATMDKETTSAVDVAAVRQEALQTERTRMQMITAVGEKHGQQELAREFIGNGKSVDEFREAVLSKIAVRQTAISGTEADIGLSQKEIGSFSFVRAINALANPTNRKLVEAASFEFEVSQAAAKARGKESQGIFVPYEVLRAGAQRDLSKGTPSAGGYLVGTQHLSSSFIELLRKKSILDRAGATVLNGLVGDIAIPKQTGGATAYWVGEGSAPTESQQTFGQVAMAPKTVGAFTDMSRKLLIQSSPDVENLVKMDLAKVLALAIDSAGLYGSGSANQPLGVSGVSGINTKDFAAAMPTFTELVAMESLIAADDADVDAMKYLTEPTVRGAMKTAVKFSSTASPIWEPGNSMNGYAALVSTQITAEDVFFGNWADLMIGYWSGLDLTVDPSALATSGGLRVIALQDVDVAVRHAESFCWGNDAQ